MPRVKSTRVSRMERMDESDIKPDLTQLDRERIKRPKSTRSHDRDQVMPGVTKSEIDLKPVLDEVLGASEVRDEGGRGYTGGSTSEIARPRQKKAKISRPQVRARAGTETGRMTEIGEGEVGARDELDKILDRPTLGSGSSGSIGISQAVRATFTGEVVVRMGGTESNVVASGSGGPSSLGVGKSRIGIAIKEETVVRTQYTAPNVPVGEETGPNVADTTMNDRAGSTQGSSAGSLKVDTKGKGKAKVKVEATPRRPIRWRKKCPVSTMERLDRVMNQRMFLLDRSGQVALKEDFKILGSTGNVYTVTIGSTPLCDCPDAGKGNIPCKHIIFVFMKVLKLPSTSEMWYQKYLLDDELESIFATAPPVVQGAYEVPARARAAYLKASGRESEIPIGDRAPEPDPDAGSASTSAVNLNRKDPIGEDCPVCFDEFQQTDIDNKLLVWDDSLYGCGKALHTECFKKWADSVIKREGSGAEVKCVWCRSTWPTPPSASGGSAGSGLTSGGYLNIGDLVGVSRKRDTSSYYWGPMRGRRMDAPRYEDD